MTKHLTTAGAVTIALLWTGLLSSRLAADESEPRHADAVGVFHCAFGEDWDVNYDRWPDRWERKTGPDYPHYVGMQIEDDPTAVGGRSLRIDLDGAGAAVASPPIHVMSRFSYVLEARLKNEALKHSVVVLTLDFYDKQGELRQSHQSQPISNTDGWQQVQLGPIEPKDTEIDRAVIGLQVVRGNRGDLRGRVSLDDVWLARYPKITVTTNNPFNVYSDQKDVVIACELSGILERDPEICFQLYDATHTELQQERLRFDGHLIVEQSRSAADTIDGTRGTPAGYEGRVEWRPNIPDFGYYRVVVRMLSSESAEDVAEVERELDHRVVWLAVVPPLPMPEEGDFGWTLAADHQSLPLQDLSRLLPQVGISWVKVPVWFRASEPRQGDEIIRFVELLGASNIEVVGVIDRPPSDPASVGTSDQLVPVAEVVAADPSNWAPALDPVMTRLSLRIRWWQLGRDDDASFAGTPDLPQRFDELRTRLFRFGQDVRLGLSWNWDFPQHFVGNVPWDFEQFTSDEPPTQEKLREYLSRPHDNSSVRWIVVEPPDIGEPTLPTDEVERNRQTGEFVRRLVAAKVEGAAAIFVTNPFNDVNGLMHSNGMPAEMLLPWRTTAAMISGGEYLGELQLPGGSENRVFLRPDGQVVMAVWNDLPTQEVLYLGPDVQHFDVWGYATAPEAEGHDQVIPVGPLPSFVLGMNEAVTRWRLALNFEEYQVPSVYAVVHPNGLRFRNYFPQGVGGSLRIVVPQDDFDSERGGGEDDDAPESQAIVQDRWSIEPPQTTFRMAPGEEAVFPFEVRLKNAMFGKQPVRVDFHVEADQPYRFSVYREMEVGTNDLTLRVRTRLDEDGTLIVEQVMANYATRPADFRCYLYAKGHRRQRAQVYRLATTPDRKVYRFPNGSELVGNDLLLEIEDLNGPRVIKYRFTATETSDDEDEKLADETDDESVGGSVRPTADTWSTDNLR